MKTLIMLKDTLIFLKDMMAYENGGEKTTALEVDSDDTIYSVMGQVEEMTDVPPTLQMLIFKGKSFYHDTPGTLAENELVPTYPDPILVEYTDPAKLVDYMLQRNTLRGLGFQVDDDLFPDASMMLQLVRSHGQKMMISLTDCIREDGAGRKMMLVVEPGDTVASLKEQVQRRRRYPPAMQEIWVSDTDKPYKGRRMDRLDATLADYNVKKDSVINLEMSRGFAIQVDREEQGKVLNEAEEIAEQQQRRPARRVCETGIMQMHVRQDLLTHGKTIVLWVDPKNDTVYSVMAQIEDATGVPPILQRILPCFYYNTPGSLAENKLAVYVSPNCHAYVTVTGTAMGWNRLHNKTLRNLGFNVDAKLDVDYSAGHKKQMFISVMDYIRMDGGKREMWISVVAWDTVGSLMERVQRRRRYPVAMQQFWVSNAGCPDMERRMDKLDATLADYNVKRDSLIKLRMNKEIAWQAHMERGALKANKAKEVADDEEK